MKAKLVEKLEFTMGQEPSKSLNIGIAKEIKERLEALYPESNDAISARQYIYLSPDLIIIRYKEELIERIKASKDDSYRRENLHLYLIKWSEIPMYEVRDYDHDSTFYDTRIEYNEIAIYEKIFREPRDPAHMGPKEEIFVTKNRKKNPEAVLKKFEIMAAALNEKMGPARGFDLVKESKISAADYENKVKEIIDAS